MTLLSLFISFRNHYPPDHVAIIEVQQRIAGEWVLLDAASLIYPRQAKAFVLRPWLYADDGLQGTGRKNHERNEQARPGTRRNQSFYLM